MSAYKVIRTQLNNRRTLVKALTEIFGTDGIQVAEGNRITLRNDWRHQDHQVSIAVSREHVRKITGSAYGGIGFELDGKAYNMIVDDLDNNPDSNPRYASLVNDIKQKYAYYEVVRQAQAQGYSVKKETGEAGVIRLKLAKL